ncbi:MAG TPA: PAS domain S-box protein [Abditibacterium sp.]
MNNVVPPDEEERLRQLYQYAILDTPAEVEFDRVVRLAQRLFQVPVAFITFVDRDRQWFKASCGLESSEAEREFAICAHAILSDEVLVVADLLKDERFAHMPCALGDNPIRFYAGAPITLPEGFQLGAVAIVDTQPREMSPDEISLLQDLSSIVVSEMERRLLIKNSPDEGVSLDGFPDRLRERYENWVQQRTAPWVVANTQLQDEIARRQQIEEELRASEGKYRLLVEQSSDAIVVSDETGKILQINQAAHNMLGYNLEEVIGKNVVDFTTPEHIEEDTNSLKNLCQNTSVLLERSVIRKDGTILPVEVSVNKIGDGLLQATARDISIRKRAEIEMRELNSWLEQRVQERTAELDAAIQQLNHEVQERREAARALEESNRRLTTTLESINDGFYSLDKEWRFTFVNAAAERINGKSRKEMLGHRIWDVFPEIVSTSFWEEYHRAASTGIPSNFEEFYAPTQIWYRIYCYPSDDGLTIYFQDITSRKSVKKALQQAKEEAERASEAKTDFLSRMSHELRTPLNAILGFAQLFELEEMNEEDRENVDQILHAGRHLLELINEVLDIARVESGQVTLSIEPVAVGELTQEVMGLVQTMASDQHVTISNEIGMDGPYVMADRQRLKQVLLNLISNSIKYNRFGGNVKISCREISYSSTTEKWLRIEVKDTGRGISKEGLKKLFTPFERLGAEETPIEGTGIGLSLSKRLVELMKGLIGVQSVKDEGSNFWIEMPSTEDPSANILESMAVYLEPAKAAHTVLYVEDNLSNLKLVERILLRRADVKLIAGMQGSIALDLARENRPDLILLDLNLPDISGNEVLRQLRQSPETRDITVIILSADATPNQIERLLAAGAYEYLTKPLNVRKFIAVLDTVLPKKGEQA